MTKLLGHFTPMLYLSIPFAVVAAIFWVMALRQGGWDGLGYAVYGMLTIGFWALLFTLYLGGVVVSLGWHRDNLIPASLLGVILAGVAGWGIWHFSSNRACQVAERFFYEELATGDRAAIRARIHEKRSLVIASHPCGQSALMLRLGKDQRYNDPPLEAAARLEIFQSLLDAGLKVSPAMRMHAATEGDALLLGAMVKGPEDFPLALALEAARRIDLDPTSPYHAEAEGYREVIALFLRHHPLEPPGTTAEEKELLELLARTPGSAVSIHP